MIGLKACSWARTVRIKHVTQSVMNGIPTLEHRNDKARA
ncbi:hypothetical protein ALQ62_01197 [Pseudomonas coronafaciens pv. zizaniae]|nr:hypothetical protein ALQ62_01197 [Pseudomonas coronafaciens pv. zizaniae]